MNKETKTKKCSDCQEAKPADTKHFFPFDSEGKYLQKRCQVCEAKRRVAKGKEYYDRSKARAKEKQANKKPIQHFSQKGKAIYDQLNGVKKQIRAEADNLDNRFCRGCGRGDVGLDCSHILSTKQRPDLQFDKHNVNLLCRNCHLKHESFDIKLMLELKCFESDMKYIYAHDQQKFNKVLFKLLDYIEKHDDSKAKKILERVEKFEDEIK